MLYYAKLKKKIIKYKLSNLSYLSLDQNENNIWKLRHNQPIFRKHAEKFIHHSSLYEPGLLPNFPGFFHKFLNF